MSNTGNIALKREITPEEHKRLLIDLLSYINEFCLQNSIKYFFGYGTLLGAVRHQGFIPRDDDVDICMLREDYNRFLTMFSYNAVRSNYSLLSLESTSRNYSFPYAKVIDNRTLLVENVSHPCLLGVYIDVFPLDYCPETHFKTALQLKKIRTLKSLRNIKLIKLSCKRNWLKTCFFAVAKIPPISCFTEIFIRENFKISAKI